jgi:hypothetical protein
MLKNIEVAR